MLGIRQLGLSTEREDRLGRSIVLLKGDDVSRGPELVWKIKDVADGCRPERINRLGIVPDHHQAVALSFNLNKILDCSRLVS